MDFRAVLPLRGCTWIIKSARALHPRGDVELLHF